MNTRIMQRFCGLRDTHTMLEQKLLGQSNLQIREIPQYAAARYLLKGMGKMAFAEMKLRSKLVQRDITIKIMPDINLDLAHHLPQLLRGRRPAVFTFGQHI